jgi:pimeloyl-[acyl-carrier protein] methyl ester esterase
MRRGGGAGLDLALIHGWGLGSGVWQPLVASLSRAWRVHLVDLPGYGESSGGSEDFTQAARDLIDDLPDSVTLCGWSLGAMLAMRAALLAPQRVAGLLLVGATPSFTQRGDWYPAQAPQVLDSFSDSLGRQPEQTLQRFVALLCQGDQHARTLTRTLLACLRSQPTPAVETLRRGLDWLREVDLRSLLPTMTTRCLLIHGEHDRLNPVAAAQYLSTTLPDARLEIVSGAGHAPFLTDPEGFVQLLETFCHARPAT